MQEGPGDAGLAAIRSLSLISRSSLLRSAALRWIAVRARFASGGSFLTSGLGPRCSLDARSFALSSAAIFNRRDASRLRALLGFGSDLRPRIRLRNSLGRVVLRCSCAEQKNGSAKPDDRAPESADFTPRVHVFASHKGSFSFVPAFRRVGHPPCDGRHGVNVRVDFDGSRTGGLHWCNLSVRRGERSSEVVTNSLSRAYYGGSGSVTATRKNCYREVAGSCRALPR